MRCLAFPMLPLNCGCLGAVDALDIWLPHQKYTDHVHLPEAVTDVVNHHLSNQPTGELSPI